jgi:hypothetical protein
VSVVDRVTGDRTNSEALEELNIVLSVCWDVEKAGYECNLSVFDRLSCRRETGDQS